MESILKYPRTPHLQGSRLQPGDEDCSQISYSEIAGLHIVVEEKLDGANSGVRFNENAELLLQSRGHYLIGGDREKHFNLLKAWGAAIEGQLFDRLGSRFLMFGEWMHAKHTVYYDRLPHYFLEFDLFDTLADAFLSTAARRELLHDSPVASVPVLFEGTAPRRIEDLLALLQPSLAKSAQWRDSLRETARRRGLDVERVVRETESSDLAEGLYIKIERGREAVGRLKWVRSTFQQTITSNESHWLSRPIVPNQLAPGVDIFTGTVMPWPVLGATGDVACAA